MKRSSPAGRRADVEHRPDRLPLPTWKVPEIMATLGPTLEKEEDVVQAIAAGARWIRLHCGYRQRPHVDNGRLVRAAAGQAGAPVQLLLDLPSSRPRTGAMQDLRLALGDKVVFWDPEISSQAPAKNGSWPVPLPGLGELFDKLEPKHRVLFCDGRITFIVDKLEEGFVAAHLADGTIPLKSSNSLFLPDSSSGFRPITPLDRELLKEFAAAKVIPDWVALSLIATPEDVLEGRAEARKCVGQEIGIMAKIETSAAVENAEAIVAVADAIMVARGDLGQAVGYARLPEVQEQLVAAARRAGKPVVVATQILETYAATGLPQRAELSDLSLIARQRADVIMFGKETVFSPRPLDCIRLANEILTYETRRLEKAYGA
ncbi:MAG: pyruvate kinase [Limisphaerales bacterium]